MRRAAIIISVVAVIAFVALLSLGNPNLVGGSELESEERQVTTQNAQQPTAEISTVRDSNQVIGEGRLIPMRFVDLSFNTSGLIEEVLVNEGDQVSAGQLLGRLSNREEYEANIAAAELELTNAQLDIQELYNEAPLQAAEAFQELVNAPEDVSDAQRAVDSLQSGIVNETDVDERQTYTLTEEARLAYPDLVFKVQVGAFNEADAERLVGFFREKGLNLLTNAVNQSGMTTVMTGSFKGYEDARIQRDRIRQEGYEDAFVVVFSGQNRLKISDVLEAENPE